MSVITRGIRNAFRNSVRTASIVAILGLSLGLSLAMLVAHQAVNKKITDIKSSVGNTITVSPAGVRGFGGGGNPLTTTDINKITALPHVASVTSTLDDRLTASDTNLKSAIDAGSLGERFAGNSGQTFSFRSGGSGATTSFTPPVTVLGTNTPADLSDTQGGGSFTLKSGTVFASGSTADVALVGSDLGTKNNLSVGSTFTAYKTTFKVIGIFDAGNTFSNNQVIMPLSVVQKLSGQSGDVTSVSVTTDSVTNVNSVASAIKTALGGAADVTSSEDRAQSAIAPLQNIQNISLYSLIGAAVAGAVIIFMTMLMIVRERRREIGVLKAIGASNLKVVWQFMSEAITLTLLAAIVGIVIGVAAASPITNTLVSNSTNSSSPPSASTAATASNDGGQISRFVAGGRGLGSVRNNITNVHAVVGWGIVLYGLATALIIAIIGSGVASWFISKIRPAEVMRVE